jgi:hypothetical protein
VVGLKTAAPYSRGTKSKLVAWARNCCIKLVHTGGPPRHSLKAFRAGSLRGSMAPRSSGPASAVGLSAPVNWEHTEKALTTAAASKQAGTCGESSSSSLELLCSVAAMLTVATIRGEERRGDCEASNEREASCDAEKMGASKHGGMRLPSVWQQLLMCCKKTHTANVYPPPPPHALCCAVLCCGHTHI